MKMVKAIWRFFFPKYTDWKYEKTFKREVWYYDINQGMDPLDEPTKLRIEKCKKFSRQNVYNGKKQIHIEIVSTKNIK